MNPKTEKILSIIVVLTALVVAIIMGIGYYRGLQLQKRLKTESKEFVLKWANFTDQSSDTYLASIKPYLSADIYKDQVAIAKELKQFSEKDYQPNISSFTISSEPEVTKSDSSYTVSITGTRKYEGEDSYTEKIDLTWSKGESGYKISEINSDKQ